MTPPQTLDHAGIAARIPHQGRMCLLDGLLGWDARQIHCRASSHQAADNPLRTASGLLAPAAIEYAAQAMALHGALLGAGAEPQQPGYLASVRAVQLPVPLLHTLDGPLQVRAQRLAGDARQILYQFEITDARGQPVAQGRATVVLGQPLPAAPPAPDGMPTTRTPP